MQITTKTGLVGFFLVLSALNMPASNAAVKTTDNNTNAPVTIESRLSRIAETLKDRQTQLQDDLDPLEYEEYVAIGWANGRRGGWVDGRRGGGWADSKRGDWVNGRRGGGWADGRGGSWVNGRRGGGWGDGGRFVNYR